MGFQGIAEGSMSVQGVQAVPVAFQVHSKGFRSVTGGSMGVPWSFVGFQGALYDVRGVLESYRCIPGSFRRL